MQSTVIELRVSPPFERPHIQGVLARLLVPHDPTSQEAKIYARPYQAMDWMEFEPGTELKDIKPRSVSSAHAHALIKLLRGVLLPPLVSSGAFGIHETTFRLRVSSSVNSSEYNWSSEPPPEWQVLGDVARQVQEMAQEGFSAV